MGPRREQEGLNGGRGTRQVLIKRKLMSAGGLLPQVGGGDRLTQPCPRPEELLAGLEPRAFIWVWGRSCKHSLSQQFLSELSKGKPALFLSRLLVFAVSRSLTCPTVYTGAQLLSSFPRAVCKRSLPETSCALYFALIFTIQRPLFG